jgi:hypothetical protein
MSLKQYYFVCIALGRQGNYGCKSCQDSADGSANKLYHCKHALNNDILVALL